MTTIFCDEAGNSGAHLLDKDQPYFVLASNDFSDEEARHLLEHVRSAQGAEPKFTSLKKTAVGVRKLVAFMSDPLLTRERVAANYIDKAFMVTTKLVDLITETLAHLGGEDLYAGGKNQALSNVLYYAIPGKCGPEAAQAFLDSFVALVRHRTDAHREAFYAAGEQVLEACDDEALREHLRPLVDRRIFPIWFSNEVNMFALDPAIPSLFSHMAHWTQRKELRFDVVHDSSKPIAAKEKDFRQFMARSDEEYRATRRIVGYDRREILLPLGARSLRQSDSRAHPQLQVSDLCAGLVNHLLKSVTADERDNLAEQAMHGQVATWAFDSVEPSLAITPEELSIERRAGANLVDGALEFLKGGSPT